MSNFGEVDRILLRQLSEVGIDFSGADDLLIKENFYLSCVYCMKQLVSDLSIAEELESGMGTWKKQIQQCKDLGAILKDKLGFRGEISYDNFLYPTAQVVRKILSFLIAKVQRIQERKKSKTFKKKPESMNDKIEKEIENQFNQTYVVPWCQRKEKRYKVNTKLIFVPDLLNEKPRTVFKQQKDKDQLAITVFEDNLKSITLDEIREKEWKNKKGKQKVAAEDKNEFFNIKKKKVHGFIAQIMKKSKKEFGDNSKYKFERDSLGTKFAMVGQTEGREIGANGKLIGGIKEKEGDLTRTGMEKGGLSVDEEKEEGEETKKLDPLSDEAKEAREKELGKYENVIEKLHGTINKIDEKMGIIKTAITPLIESEEKEKEIGRKLQKEYKLLEQTVKLFKNKDENLVKLKKINSNSAQRLLKMAAEWEKYRKPKMKMIRKLKREIIAYKEDYRLETEKIQKKKDEMKNFINEIKKKQEEYKRLVEHFNNLPKDKDRNFYVEKILDNVGNISNQTDQIKKILFENRDVKDKIVTAVNKSQDIFKELTDKVFVNAKKNIKGDKISTQLYKDLVEINNEFDKMIKSVGQEGKNLNKIRDLEADIDFISQRNDESNTKKIQKDLNLIKKENEAIVQKLKAIKAKLMKK